MKFTIAAVSCMIEENTGNIILDPDSTQLQVRTQIPAYVRKERTAIFKRLLNDFRMLGQNSLMHLTVRERMLYAATLLVVLWKQSF